jgi:catechol 2,3-dioxygenase-like lactoylglutathione lyase family enzyme
VAEAKPMILTAVPIEAICLLCHDVEKLLRFYTGPMGLKVRRREESFIQFHKSYGLNLCLWEIGHIKKHIGFDVWPQGDRSAKLLNAVRFDSPGAVDETYSNLKGSGVPVIRPPQQYRWGAYAFYFADPDGNCWEFHTWLPGGPRGSTFYTEGDPSAQNRR